MVKWSFTMKFYLFIFFYIFGLWDGKVKLYNEVLFVFFSTFLDYEMVVPCFGSNLGTWIVFHATSTIICNYKSLMFISLFYLAINIYTWFTKAVMGLVFKDWWLAGNRECLLKSPSQIPDMELRILTRVFEKF